MQPTLDMYNSRSWRFPFPIAYRQETLAIIHKGGLVLVGDFRLLLSNLCGGNGKAQAKIESFCRAGE